jgi:hypothetical protein
VLIFFANVVAKRANVLELNLVNIKGLTTAKLLISAHPTAVYIIKIKMQR